MKQNIFVGIASIFGIMEIIVFLSMLMGKDLYILNNSKKYFIACFSIGFIMCCFGITRNLQALNWLNPLTILACVLGAAACAIFIWIIWKETAVSDAKYKMASILIFIIVIAKWAMQMLKDYVIK